MHLIYITLLVIVLTIANSKLQCSQFSFKNLQNKNRYRIYKGQIAKPNSVPYQVGLFPVGTTTIQICSGSLIKPQFVLTAAHCFETAISVRMVIGTNSLHGPPDMKYSVEAMNFKIHELYDPYTVKNDIAIVKLMRPVKLSNKIAIIRLPKKSDTSSLVNKYGIVTGWGRTSDIKIEMNAILKLKTLKVRVVNIQECLKEGKFQIDSTKLCGIGEQNGSACIGDSGGPLVLDNTDIQIGIVSFGSRAGCTLGYPHVYTNVASYLDWISKWSC